MCTNKSQNKHIITSKDLTTIRKYCALCIIRSELFVDAVRRHSDYIDLIANEPQNIVAGAYFDESEIIDNFSMISILQCLPVVKRVGLFCHKAV